MALGHCKTCGELVTIKQKPWIEKGVALSAVRLGQTRAAVWYPEAHNGPDGKPCTGLKRPV